MGLNIRMTPAVRALVIATAAASLVQAIANQFVPFNAFDTWLGLVPALVAHGAVWQLATYAMLHGGFWHLFFNLFALASLGPAVEDRLGTAAFARFYAFCGIGAGFCALVLGWGSHNAVIGASGAIFGVIMAFGILYPRRPVTLLLALIVPVTLEGRMLAAVFGALNLYVLAQNGGQGLGQLAHLGGLLFGWLWFRLPELPDWRGAWRARTSRRRADRLDRAYASVSAERRALQDEVDGLLDKISREGMAGLSDREKRRLVEASERLKRL